MWTKLTLSFTAFLLVLVVGEALLAVTGQHSPSGPVYAGERIAARNDNVDPMIGWKMPPEKEVRSAPDHGDFAVTYTSNRQGFRDRRDFDPGPERQRIAFLGDSFTFGIGVSDEEAFPALVESALPGTRGHNFGMSGFGIDQMWMTLRHHAAPLEPDLVVLAFVQDDLSRSLSAYRERSGWMAKPTFRLEGGRPVPLTAEQRPNAVVRFIERRSRLFQAWRQLERKLGQTHALGYRWKLNRALFREIRDDCARSGARLLVVRIPTGDRAPALAGEFADLGVPYLDLEAQVTAAAGPLYFEHDPHLNAAGHRLVAEAITAFIAEHDLLPGGDGFGPALSSLAQGAGGS